MYIVNFEIEHKCLRPILRHHSNNDNVEKLVFIFEHNTVKRLILVSFYIDHNDFTESDLLINDENGILGTFGLKTEDFKDVQEMLDTATNFINNNIEELTPNLTMININSPKICDIMDLYLMFHNKKERTTQRVICF